MFWTLLTSQLPISWLKSVASLNINLIFVTLLTSQLPIFWLKVLLPLNASNKLDRCETSQVLTSSPDVSQPLISSNVIGFPLFTAVTPLPVLPPISNWTPSTKQSALAWWLKQIKNKKRDKIKFLENLWIIWVK